MNSLSNQVRIVLQFFAGLVGTIVLSIVFGIIGTSIYEYLGVVLFIITFIVGVLGSIKRYITASTAK